MRLAEIEKFGCSCCARATPAPASHATATRNLRMCGFLFQRGDCAPCVSPSQRQEGAVADQVSKADVLDNRVHSDRIEGNGNPSEPIGPCCCRTAPVDALRRTGHAAAGD